MRNPKVGDYLYSTCTGGDYGTVVAVGFDANGFACIDIEVIEPNDLISFSKESHALTTIKLPEGVKIILQHVLRLILAPSPGGHI